MHLPLHAGPRRRTRRALLAAALPAVLAAIALPSAAEAQSPGAQFTSVNLGSFTPLTINATTTNPSLPSVNNNISLRLLSSTLRVTDTSDNVVASGLCVNVTPNEASCPLAQLDQLVANLDGNETGGNDTWRSDVPIKTTVNGGGGNDTLIRDSGSRVSRTDFRGGSGQDRADYSGSPAGVFVDSADNLANDGRSGVDFDNIRGDVELLVGSSFGDTLLASLGNDIIAGGLGDDVMGGNVGADIILESSTPDGADFINGGIGAEDTVMYLTRTSGVNVSIDGVDNDGAPGEGDDVRPSIEHIVGSNHADRLIGNEFANNIDGHGGNEIVIDGRQGNDTLTGGAGQDRNILAGAGNDVVFARDGEADSVACGTDTDTAHLDADRDNSSLCEKFPPVGVLRLAQKAVSAEAGKPAHVRLSWRHPQDWRKLRKLELRLTRDGVPVGEIAIRPRGERLADDGAVELVRTRSRLTHDRNTVAAHLALRLDKSLAGETLKAEVEATDTRGRRQLERDAGTIRVGA